MATCAYCGKTKWFGAVTRDGLSFCNNQCSQYGALLDYANSLPQDFVADYVGRMQVSNCPKCSGPGPIEVHTAHQVWSALVLTRWTSQPRICCKKCATVSQLGGIGFSAVLGWWGFPWGLVMTPVQILRNVGEMFYNPKPGQPSAAFVKLLKINLASNVIQQQRAQEGASVQTVSG